MPKNWPTLRAAVKRRANNLCQAQQHEPDCNGYGSQCDHIEAGDNHAMSNLQWLSAACHGAKTLREAQAGWRRTNGNARRPAEMHPGLINKA